jgi:small subunit ribosomal protein S20
MANIKSAKKRAKTNEKRRTINVSRRSDIKTAMKKVLDVVTTGDTQLATTLFRATASKISRAASKGVLKNNTASRYISRLARKLTTLGHVSR